MCSKPIVDRVSTVSACVRFIPSVVCSFSVFEYHVSLCPYHLLFVCLVFDARATIAGLKVDQGHKYGSGLKANKLTTAESYRVTEVHALT